uniref:Uncharacterized protein n=1 Tax=Percolomonas cosmopolitus TaxID=63605 RepID=A0A7S1KMJ9_9EUKA|eukprot:CAMPEP_0117441332 /NCGR_PEP_ID=MMETSP0759-20121206/3579_1 /TAXON_ID=63605 /ORGANISM="Percolomonas cosmopolitus, Strain WS" /LENGTH=1653 /DNA_ID=CAMNT_0005233181 /DNA_START=277 /DNA_END=5238 /DNA_ORIENTATION=+
MFHLQTLIRDGAYMKPASKSAHSNRFKSRKTSDTLQLNETDDESTIKTEIGGPVINEDEMALRANESLSLDDEQDENALHVEGKIEHEHHTAQQEAHQSTPNLHDELPPAEHHNQFPASTQDDTKPTQVSSESHAESTPTDTKPSDPVTLSEHASNLPVEDKLLNEPVVQPKQEPGQTASTPFIATTTTTTESQKEKIIPHTVNNSAFSAQTHDSSARQVPHDGDEFVTTKHDIDTSLPQSVQPMVSSAATVAAVATTLPSKSQQDHRAESLTQEAPHAQPEERHLSLDSLNFLRVFVIQIHLVPYFASMEDALNGYFHTNPIVQSNFTSFATDLLLLHHPTQISNLFSELLAYFSSQSLSVSQLLHIMHTQSISAHALIDLCHKILKEYAAVGIYEKTLPIDLISPEVATNTLENALPQDAEPIFQLPHCEMERSQFVSLLHSVDELFVIRDSYHSLKQLLHHEISQKPTLLSDSFSSYSHIPRIQFLRTISTCLPSVKTPSIDYLFNQIDEDRDNLVTYIQFTKEVFGDAPHPSIPEHGGTSQLPPDTERSQPEELIHSVVPEPSIDSSQVSVKEKATTENSQVEQQVTVEVIQKSEAVSPVQSTTAVIDTRPPKVDTVFATPDQHASVRHLQPVTQTTVTLPHPASIPISPPANNDKPRVAVPSAHVASEETIVFASHQHQREQEELVPSHNNSRDPQPDPHQCASSVEQPTLVKEQPSASVGAVARSNINPSPLEVSETGSRIVIPTTEASTQMISPSRQSTEKKYLPGTAPESQLHVAARKGNVDEVRDLLQKGVIYRRTVDGVSPLWIACQEGHYEIAHELVISGSDINEPCNTGATPLLVAAQYGHAQIVRFLLENGANVNARQNTKETALMLASEEGHAEVVQELLTYNALVNSKDNDGVTALHISSLFGHIAVVRELISHNASLNERDQDGSTPLFLASEAGHLPCVTALIQAGASSRISDNAGTTCLHISSQEGHLDVARLLLQDGAEPNAATLEGATSLILAVQEGHSELVQELLHFGADPDVEHKGVSPLIVATHRGHDASIKLLCNAGANVNCKLRTGETPLFIAAERGFLDGVRVLLQYGSNPNSGSAEVGTPLFVACYKGHVKIVRELIRYEADLEYSEADGTTALIMAVETGNLEVVRELVKAYSNVNACTNTNGNAPLHIVAQRGDVEMAKILTNGGTNVNQVNTAGDTPLIIATRNGHIEIVQLLLSFSAHVNSTNKMGESALFSASQQEDLKIFRLLIRKRYGADINLPLHDGTTILSKACADGHYQLVRLIVEAKLNSVSYPVDLNKIGHDGMTPLQHAVRGEHIEIVKLLLLAGVDIGKLSDESKAAYDLSHNERIRDLLMMHSNGEPRKSTSMSVDHNGMASPKSNGFRPPNMYIALAKDADDEDESLHVSTPQNKSSTKNLQLYGESAHAGEGSYILKAPNQRYRPDSNDTLAQFTGLQKQLVEQFSFQNQQLMKQTTELNVQMQQQLQFQQEQMKLQTKQMEILERLSHRVGGSVDTDKIEGIIEKKLDTVLSRILHKDSQPRDRARRASPSSVSRSSKSSDSLKYYMDDNLDDDEEDPQKILDSILTPRFTYNDPVPSPRTSAKLDEIDESNRAVPPLDIPSSTYSPQGSRSSVESGRGRSRNHRLIL